MALLKTFMVNKGFTLVEVLIVIGIIGILAGLSSLADLNSYRSYAFQREVGSLGVALQSARANALNNINQEMHGVAIKPYGYDGYVIFQGSSYATRMSDLDVVIKTWYEVNISSSPSEIVFAQLSGNANYDGDIVITDPNRGITASITINHEGKISW